MTGAAWTLLALSAFGAGAVNAVAGGGSFLTFPALVFAGVPPIAANATSAVALSPGYLGSTAGFRAELAAQQKAGLAREGLLCALGGASGALLLLLTPARVFVQAVPWLLLFATALFALGPRLLAFRPSGLAAGTQALGLFAVSLYGGYFNGGLGILLMALYACSGLQDLHVANAKKNFHSLVLSLLSVMAFALAGVVFWGQAVVMMAAATAGGFCGAGIGRKLPQPWVRGLVVSSGLAMTILIFRTSR